MTKSLEIQQRIAELNRELYEPDKSADRMAQINTEIDSLTADLARARADEERQAAADFTGHTGELSAEHREAISITRRADLGVMLGHIITRRNTVGAEAEAQAAWNLDGTAVPMSMVAELRTVAAPTDGGGTAPVSGYVFPASVGAFANISRPSVPAGTPVYPSVVTSGAAGRPAEGAAHGSSEPTIRGQLLTPKRIHAVASVSVEDRLSRGDRLAGQFVNSCTRS